MYQRRDHVIRAPCQPFSPRNVKLRSGTEALSRIVADPLAPFNHASLSSPPQHSSYAPLSPLHPRPACSTIHRVTSYPPGTALTALMHSANIRQRCERVFIYTTDSFRRAESRHSCALRSSYVFPLSLPPAPTLPILHLHLAPDPLPFCPPLDVAGIFPIGRDL